MSSFFSRGSTAKNVVSEDNRTLAINRLKPHFLNNILSTIYYLCDSDPQKAQTVTATFSEYLLGALEALKKDDLASFSWEMGLIRSYLSLEKIRLDDKLAIDYDVDITDFNIPPLSVLFLVEDAVKRGISGLNETGTVKISTRRLAGGVIQIKVCDDGNPHEEPNPQKAEEIKKDYEIVRKLIQQNADGELNISKREGGGTEATITISAE